MGVLEWRYLAHYMVVGLCLVGLFYSLFKSNLNLHLKEPNLKLEQVLAPVLPVLYAIYHVTSPEARSALLLTAVVPLLYGLFDLTTRQFVAVSLLNLLGCYAMFALSTYHNSDQRYQPGQWVVIDDARRGADTDRPDRRLHQQTSANAAPEEPATE